VAETNEDFGRSVENALKFPSIDYSRFRFAVMSGSYIAANASMSMILSFAVIV
jgi:hypothetical protein